MPPVSIITVSKAESGQKLIRFLERRIGAVPRSAVQRWIRTGQVRVDGSRKKAFDRVVAGQQVRIPPYEPEDEPTRSPSNLSGQLDIVHEDEQLLVLNKPAGLAVHGGTGHTDSLTARIEQQYANAPFMPTLAHRLDKNTSGLLLVAKSYSALRGIQSAIQSRSIQKIYIAWVHGNWPHEHELSLEDCIEKTGDVNGNVNREKMSVGSGKLHSVWSKHINISPNTACLKYGFLPGLFNIRAACLSWLPIIGDTKYGAPYSCTVGRDC